MTIHMDDQNSYDTGRWLSGVTRAAWRHAAHILPSSATDEWWWRYERLFSVSLTMN